jgi:hypothetical protein
MKFIKHVLSKNGMSNLNFFYDTVNINSFSFRRRQTTSTNLLDSNPRGSIDLTKEIFRTWSRLKHFSGTTLTQTSKSTSSVSDYLPGGKKPFTIGNHYHTTAAARNEPSSSKFGNEKPLENICLIE